MAWIAENWLVLLLLAGMIAMHIFGHGHGSKGHGGRVHPLTGDARRRQREAAQDKTDRDPDAKDGDTK